MPDSQSSNFNTLNANTSVKRAKEIIFQQFDDELLAVDAQGSVCYSLNESAGRIWDLLETPTAVGAICTQLSAEYAVDDATCLREVSSVLQELNVAGLVQLGEDATQ